MMPKKMKLMGKRLRIEPKQNIVIIQTKYTTLQYIHCVYVLIAIFMHHRLVGK